MTVIDQAGLGQQIKAVDEIEIRVGKGKETFYRVPVCMIDLHPPTLSIVR